MELASSLDANRLITGAGCCGRLLTVSSSVKSITIDVVGAVCSLKVDVEKSAPPEFTVVDGIVLAVLGLPSAVMVVQLRFSPKLREPDRVEQGRVGQRSQLQSHTEKS
jgi:hypothetical protein